MKPPGTKLNMKAIGGGFIVAAAFVIMLPGFVTYLFGLSRLLILVLVTLLIAFAIAFAVQHSMSRSRKKNAAGSKDQSKDSLGSTKPVDNTIIT